MNSNYSYRVKKAISSFSLTAKTLFFVAVSIFIISCFSILVTVSNHFLVTIPRYGGTLTEGMIDSPRFINPLLAITDSDKDLVSLIYSGLLRRSPTGELIPDIAQSYTISSDGRIYTFFLKNNVYFHDGSRVTAEDVEFTIQKAQDQTINSNKYTNWQGVEVKKINQLEIVFILHQPYAAFIENATLGILPKHLWASVASKNFVRGDLNNRPVGSGPYMFSSLTKTADGIPLSYTLHAFKNFALGRPLIDTVVTKFYSNEKNLIAAYQNNTVDSINSISPQSAQNLKKSGSRIVTSELPRIFGIFLNQSRSKALSDVNIRQALDISINREYIVNTVLQSFGTPLHGPVPTNFVNAPGLQLYATSSIPQYHIDEANALLDKAGWNIHAEGIREKKFGKEVIPLSFSISTPDAPELKEVASILQAEWKKIGVAVDIKVFEGGYLNQNIIRPRNYDALLFGQVIHRDLDLYPFWHSSQKTDPGLNVALYSNKRADAALEQLRTTQDIKTRIDEYTVLTTEIQHDIPALFLYSPDFIYLIPVNIKNITISSITTPSERFQNIYEWYIETEKIWKIKNY